MIEINDAFKRVGRSDARYRFAIGMALLKA